MIARKVGVHSGGLKINRSLFRDSARMMGHKSFPEFSRTARVTAKTNGVIKHDRMIDHTERNDGLDAGTTGSHCEL